MLTLGIESSCDETGVSIVEWSKEKNKINILAEEVHSQVKLHAEYGGVVPELAAREHTTNLEHVMDAALTSSNCNLSDLSQIAVTTGPGLKGCLLTGMLYASGLSEALSIPLVPVNHIEAHVLSVFIDHPDIPLPFIALIVSGGHTELQFIEDIGKYHLIARTIDDAAGEAFDKSANLLGIDYPGGATLAKLADSYAIDNNSESAPYSLPAVMKGSPGFSFSGLKTAISLLIKKEMDSATLSTKETKAALSYSIQESITDSLVSKTKNAIDLLKCNRVAVVGGVSANSTLREKIDGIEGTDSYYPTPYHCRDNGTMIATCAIYRERNKLPHAPFTAQPRWKIETKDISGKI